MNSLRSKRKGKGRGERGDKKYEGKGKRGDWGGEKGRKRLQPRYCFLHLYVRRRT